MMVRSLRLASFIALVPLLLATVGVAQATGHV